MQPDGNALVPDPVEQDRIQVLLEEWGRDGAITVRAEVREGCWVSLYPPQGPLRRIGLSRVARALNERGIPTRYEKQWTAKQVGRVLDSL